jgi:hypothetical protein
MNILEKLMIEVVKYFYIDDISLEKDCEIQTVKKTRTTFIVPNRDRNTLNDIFW